MKMTGMEKETQSFKPGSPLGPVFTWCLPRRPLFSKALNYIILWRNKFYSTCPHYALQKNG